MAEPVHVIQLSDTHFLESGARPEGQGAYDTAAAFAAVLEHILANHTAIDLVVVTGDVTDHGRPEQYRVAAESLARLDVPVVACPGNHDATVAFEAGMARPGIATSRVMEAGPWSFVLPDTSAGLQTFDGHGLAHDPPGDTRLHCNGALGAREAAWVERACAAAESEHQFIWLHHPPEAPIPLSHDAAYGEEWRRLLATPALSRVRGMGAGHTHVPDSYELAGRPVHVAPSLKNNFSLTDETWLPPGYRSYRFDPDGIVTSDVHLVDDERWPRRPLGRALLAMFRGELTPDELAEIAARRAARS